jgi:hypothetical protein
MVHIKFTARPRTPIISPRFAPMASDDEHRESSSKQPEASLVDEQDAGPDEENPSDGFGDSENASASDGCMKIGAEAALVGVSYDFKQSIVTRAHATALESFACYFLKGFARPPSTESVQYPRENEVVVFEDFFAIGLRIPPHLIPLDILHKF